MSTALAKARSAIATKARAAKTEQMEAFGAVAIGGALGVAEAKGKAFPKIVDSISAPAELQAATAIAFVDLVLPIPRSIKRWLGVGATALGVVGAYKMGRDVG